MSGKHPRAAVNVMIFVLLCGAVWATFGRALHAPFFYDDRAAFVENATIRQLWPLSVPLGPPRENPFSSRPLANLSAAVNYHFGELDPAGYRLANMALHALSAVLLFGVVGRTLLLPASPLPVIARSPVAATILAFVVALLWAVHPLQTETVCYVTQRTELMVGLFYLATLYCSLRYWLAETRARRIAWLVLAVIACAAGMASKEVMVSAPLVVLLFEWTFIAPRDLRGIVRRSWPLYVGLCLTWILLVYLVADAPRSMSAGFGRGLAASTWWLTQAKVTVMYLKLAFWPWPLSIHYHLPYVQGMSAAFPALLVIGTLGVGTLVALWRGWAVGFLGAWFFLILSPTSLVPILSEVAAERRMYLPLAAIVALVVIGGYRLVVRLFPSGERESVRLSKAVAVCMLVVAALVAVVLRTVSLDRLTAYQSAVSIWEDALAKFPDSEVVHHCLAKALSLAGRHDEAVEHFQTAIRLEPTNLYHRVRFAEALRRAGRHDDAIVQLREVVLRVPEHLEAQYELARALRDVGRPQEAAEHFSAAITLNPKYAPFHVQYADVLRALGKNQEAVAQLEQAVELDPDVAEARDALAQMLEESGQTKQAAEHWAKAVALEPENAALRSHYGDALRKLGQYPQAIKQLRKASELAPQERDPYFNLAVTFAELGSPTQAIDQYRQLVKQHPDDAPAQAALGKLLVETRKYESAIEHLQRAVDLDPTLAESRNDLGAALLEVGRTDEAITQLEESVRLAPDSPAGLFNLADAYAAAGRQEQALTRARQALELARSQQNWVIVEQIETWLSAQQAAD